MGYPAAQTRASQPSLMISPPINRGRRQADYNVPAPSYGPPPTVYNPGKVIVMPPPGKVPPGYPEPGQYGGGAAPETNPYIADMAPDGTVPVAIYPPFEKQPLYPSKCVLFSELTDYEENEIDDYGNIQADKVTQFLAYF